MTIRTTGLAALLAMTLGATAVNAQEVGSGPAPGSPEEMTAIIAGLMRQLEPFARENNLPAFNAEMQGVLETYVPASLVVIPPEKAEDPTYFWAAGLRFDSGYDVPADGVLAADPAHELYGDALECSRANGDRSVAYFRRISEGGMAGHICTLGYQEEEKAILQTRTVFEGGGRRGWTNFEARAQVEGDPAAARDLLEPVIAGNVALVEAFDAVMIRNLPLATPNRPAGTPAQP